MASQLHVVYSRYNEVPVGLPGKLHLCRVQCFPHEEADFPPVR